MLESMKRQLDLYADANWDVLATEIADDVIFEEIATRTVVKGRAGFIDYVKRWKLAFPDLRARLVSGFAFADQVVAELEWEGTHTNPLDTPFGTIAPTNKRVMNRSVLVSRMSDGRLQEQRHYYDLLTVLGQLGVAPFAGVVPLAETAAQMLPPPLPQRH